MNQLEKKNLENLVDVIEQGLEDHDISISKLLSKHRCSVIVYQPYEDEEDEVASVYVNSFSADKGRYLTQQELFLFGKWLNDLYDMENRIYEASAAYEDAKDDIFKKVVAWVNK